LLAQPLFSFKKYDVLNKKELFLISFYSRLFMQKRFILGTPTPLFSFILIDSLLSNALFKAKKINKGICLNKD
jgi:hypothetical protein